LGRVWGFHNIVVHVGDRKYGKITFCIYGAPVTRTIITLTAVVVVVVLMTMIIMRIHWRKMLRRRILKWRNKSAVRMKTEFNWI
jgi:hypothetical protein